METHYKKLIVWQKAILLTKDIYTIVQVFPKTETYSLVDQMKRAVVSIPSNIAEGSLRTTVKDNIHFLHIALGSAAELETQAIISQELGFISKESSEKLQQSILEILKMLSALITSKTSQL